MINRHKFKQTFRFILLMGIIVFFTQACSNTTKVPEKRKKKKLENKHNEARLFFNSKLIKIT